MNKKLLFSLMIATLLFCGVAFGAGVPQPGSENYVIQEGQAYSPIKPNTVVIRVRYADSSPNGSKISSGDVLVWEMLSADGFTVSKCQLSNAVSYAGVAVTDILTSDVGSSLDPNSRNWGYMAIHGYCLANVDASEAIGGMPLITNGSTTISTFGTVGKAAGVNVGALSNDIGILLSNTGADGLMPVMLK